MNPVATATPSWYRELEPNMGTAIAKRTILRKKDTGEWENWGDVAERVAKGNSLLVPDFLEQLSQTNPSFSQYSRESEYELLRHHIGKGILPTSGRHLQHGDENIGSRGQEVSTNCSTSATSFGLFYLLLNGSGVGRCYDNDMMLVDWDNAPSLICVLDESHPDFDFSAHESVRDAKHKYGENKNVLWFKVPDNREGWAQALEIWEFAAFEKIHTNKLLILDFSDVRPKGTPIGGMQNRPASGPVALMNAFNKAATLKGASMAPWKQAMYIDHYFAECVLVGGARRAARIAIKHWKDLDVLDFIQIKRPIEYYNLDVEEVFKLRRDRVAQNQPQLYSFLWSSNNSIGVDKQFWDLLSLKKGTPEYMDPDAVHARKVHRLAVACSYGDGTGEPGFVNLDKLVRNDEGLNELNPEGVFGSSRYQIREETIVYLGKLLRRAKKKSYNMIVNPCSEIALFLLGGFCVIADVIPYHADTIEEAEAAIRASVRFLIRVNLMESVYSKEVKRTNRIGVGLTGLPEFAWKFFGFSFKDLIDEEKSKDFWYTLARFNRAVRDEAERYSKILGVVTPHTSTTCKPSGCMSPDTNIRLADGSATSLRKVFELNGIDLSDHSRTSDTWFDLQIPITVLDQNNEPQNVTKLYINGTTPTIEIEMEDGTVINCTYEHKFLTINRGWVRADCLTEQDEIVDHSEIVLT